LHAFAYCASTSHHPYPKIFAPLSTYACISTFEDMATVAIGLKNV
jgi:hypothetical protein